MSLIASGYVENTDGDLRCTTRAASYSAEASVGDGGTVSDGGASRQIANTVQQKTAGGRIPFGVLNLGWDFSVVVRAYYRAPASGTDYRNLISKGGVFLNNTRLAIGWRQDSSDAFEYFRNVGSLQGTEVTAATTLTDDALYTFIYRSQSGAQQFYYCDTDIGGSGTHYVLACGTTGTTEGTDGSQTIYLGGPSGWGGSSQEDGCEAGIIGVRIYDHFLSNTELNTLGNGGSGFWTGFPTEGGGSGSGAYYQSYYRSIVTR